MRRHCSGDEADLRAVQGVEHGLREHQMSVVDRVKGAAEYTYYFHFSHSLGASLRCAVLENSLYQRVLSRFLRSVRLALHPK